jgi:hypothetical protein
MNIEQISKSFKRLVVDNSPLILTYISVAGVISTTVLAVKATPKALQDLINAQTNAEEDLTPKQTIEVAWKHYVPTAISGAMTIASILGVHNVHARRNAALVTVYSITETALKEYQAKVKEQLGENKERKVREEITKDYVANTPMVNAEVLITGTGEQLCYDSFTGRYFKSDIETIRRAQNDINARIINDMYASHNDFYRLIGLPATSYGEEVGWRTDNMMDLEYTSHLAEDGRPCLCIEYHVSPVRGYYKIN